MQDEPFDSPRRHVSVREFGRDFRLEFSALRPIDDAELSRRTGWLMLSVRNPAFTNRLLRGFCEYAQAHLAGACLTVVDSPYMLNIQARRLPADRERAEVEKLLRIGDENRARCKRVVAAADSGRVRLALWQTLDGEVPEWLRAEIQQAFAAPSAFRRDVLARTRAVIAEADDECLPDYARFLVAELPVLMWLYYGAAEGIVDFYPGPNPDLLWSIERGRYAAELPGVTALARSSPGLVYVDLRERSRLPQDTAPIEAAALPS